MDLGALCRICRYKKQQHTSQTENDSNNYTSDWTDYTKLNKTYRHTHTLWHARAHGWNTHTHTQSLDFIGVSMQSKGYQIRLSDKWATLTSLWAETSRGKKLSHSLTHLFSGDTDLTEKFWNIHKEHKPTSLYNEKHAEMSVLIDFTSNKHVIILTVWACT